MASNLRTLSIDGNSCSKTHSVTTILGLTLLFLGHVTKASPAEPWNPTRIVAQFRAPMSGEPLLAEVRFEGYAAARTFLVDTGASTTMVDMRALPVSCERIGRAEVESSISNYTVDVYKPPVIYVGTARCDWIRQVGKTDLSVLTRKLGVHIDGIIGCDLLSHFCLHIDPDNERFLIAESLPDDRPPGTSLPLTIGDDKLPYLSGLLGDDVTVTFLLDTGGLISGSFSKTLLNQLMKIPGFVETGTIVRNYDSQGRSIKASQFSAPSVRLGPHVNNGIVLHPQNDSTLGLYFLYRYRTTIDFVHERVVVEPAKRFSWHDRGDYCGIDFDQNNGAYKIAALAPGCLAEKTGIKVGDTIEEVNNRPAAKFSRAEWDRLWGNPIGGNINVRVSREDILLDFVLSAE